jgi:hypothetical protein
MPWGHVTIYAKVPMPLAQMDELVKSMGWTNTGIKTPPKTDNQQAPKPNDAPLREGKGANENVPDKALTPSTGNPGSPVKALSMRCV